MSWRQSSGRDVCNRCKKTMPLGAPVYVGEVTRCCWCEADAGELFGKFADGDVVPKHHAPMVGLDEAGAEQMRELRERFAPKVAKTWGSDDE